MADAGYWDFWIHRGDVETDVAARRPDGSTAQARVPSIQVSDGQDPAIQAIREMMGLGPDDRLPSDRIGSVRLAGFAAGERLKTLLVVSKGFRNALPAAGAGFGTPFALPVDEIAEVNERVLADGRVEAAPDLAYARDVLEAAREDGLEAVAVVFMHAGRFPAHEAAVAAVAREVGFVHVVASHEAMPVDGFLKRGRAALIDAAYSTTVRAEAIRLARGLGMPAKVDAAASGLLVVSAGGGLSAPDRLTGRDGLLSSDVAAVQAGASALARLGLDGPTLDIGARRTIHGAANREPVLTASIGGQGVSAATVPHRTFDLGAWSVLATGGPRLALAAAPAADRGPAAFGHGGPLTVFDAAIATGRLVTSLLPSRYGPSADAPLDVEAARAALSAAAPGDDPVAFADAAIDLFVVEIAHRTAREHVAGGQEPADAIAVTGAAGGLFACRIGDALGAGTVLVDQGTAGSLGAARPCGLGVQGYGRPLASIDPLDLEADLLRLSRTAIENLGAAGGSIDGAVWRPVLHLGYAGLDPVIAVPLSSFDRDQAIARLETVFRGLTGFVPSGRPVVLEAIAVEASDGRPVAADPVPTRPVEDGAEPSTITRVFTGGRWRMAPVLVAERMRPGETVQGPALIGGTLGTLVVEAGWLAETHGDGRFRLRRTETRIEAYPLRGIDPAAVALVAADLAAAAGELVEWRRRTAAAASIRAGRSLGAAVTDGTGRLVAVDPPDPLGALALEAAVQAVLESHRTGMRPGDVFVHNAPYRGGTRTADVVVVSPVFEKDHPEPVLLLASRAEHGDLGGLAPGSLTPRATTIDEEGAVFDALLLRDGAAQGDGIQDQALLTLLTNNPFPARAAAETVQDLRAAAAAHLRMTTRIETLLARYGLDMILEVAVRLMDDAEARMRALVAPLTDTSFQVDLGNGAQILAALEVDREARGVVVDFTGSSAQRPSHVNAPTTATRAAVLAALLRLADGPLPLNGGTMRAVDLIVPPDSILNPSWPAAVAAGLLGTAPAVSDGLLRALKAKPLTRSATVALTSRRTAVTESVLAPSASSGPGGAPCLADPEWLEREMPVVVEDWTRNVDDDADGGAGLERRLRATEPLTATVFSGPHSRQGRGSGDAAAFVRRLDGTVDVLEDGTETLVRPHESLIVWIASDA